MISISNDDVSVLGSITETEKRKHIKPSHLRILKKEEENSYIFKVLVSKLYVFCHILSDFVLILIRMVKLLI